VVRTEDPLERESTAGVVGVSLGILLLLAAVASLAAAALLGGASDAQVLAGELFVKPLPLGLEPVKAVRLPSGDEFLVLETGDGAQEVIHRVILSRYQGPGDVKEIFQPDESEDFGEGVHEETGSLRDWERDPSYDWHTEVERGELEWGGWHAVFVRKRAFLAGGAWSDAMFVNLSTPGRYLVLIAIWPEGTEPSQGALRDLVACVSLPQPEDAPGSESSDR
jgi:hypothetical protein